MKLIYATNSVNAFVVACLGDRVQDSHEEQEF